MGTVPKKRPPPGFVATPTEHEVWCPDCPGKRMVLRASRYGLYYCCETFPKCSNKHGAHPDGAPLGTPAPKEVRLARIRAHDTFDRLWKGPPRYMSRREAYGWMQKTLGLSKDAAHIAMFGIAECERLIAAVAQYLTTAKEKP